MKKNPAFGLLATLLLSQAVASQALARDAQQPVLASVFGDHMVLQRGSPIRLWGSAPSGDELTVEFAGHSRRTKADAAGAWRVELPAVPAGGPHRLSVRSKGALVQEIEDVLVGDLWLCSGQSNMEFPVAQASGGPHAPERPVEDVRLVTIRRDSAVSPRTEFFVRPEWVVADADAVQGFSAVCWFFARELRGRHAVPLGLIHASWGGSRIEPWLETDALREAGGFEEAIELLQAYADDQRAASGRFAGIWEDWWLGNGDAEDRPWRSRDASGWRDVPGRLRDWKTWDEPALTGHDGMVWFRKSFRLTAEQAGRDAVLALGGIDEVDLTWINGMFIGTQFGWGTERRYAVPASALRAGENTVTVNVLSTWGSGGMLGPGERVALELGKESAVSLRDGWTYRKVPPGIAAPPRAPWESISGVTGLHNAMIAPLGELPMTGALWYQGESNAGDAERYERLLEALTAGWRSRFGESLRFLIVQLPNFGPLPAEPVESGWARIRDAQRRVALGHPDTGLVVTIDTGDSRDLHPPNKAIVGQRAADVAAALVFGTPGIVDGISPLRATWRSERVVVEFAQSETLVVAGARAPIAFELCGDEPSSCVYADAELEETRLLLSAPGLAPATRVRHCWADAPICNLYGASGIPVSSFEIPIDAD